jgi:hypothetical protein
MTAAEEISWIAYSKSQPFGDDRADLRSAQIAQILWNVNVSKKGSARKITDFLPFHRKPKDPDINKSVRAFFKKPTKPKE